MKDRPILGLHETVTILGEKEVKVKARIDSGATNSSIDLSLAKKLNLGPKIREIVVKSAAGVKKRPVVKAKVKIGNLEIEEVFTLANRSHMTYQVLIGQNILKKGKFLIDPLKEGGKK